MTRRDQKNTGGSVILRALHRMSDAVSAAVLGSAIGRFLTGDAQVSGRKPTEKAPHHRRKRADRPAFRLRRSLSGVLERSLICRAVQAAERELLYTGLKSYGIFALFFGCYCIVNYYVLGNVGGRGDVLPYAITGGLLVLLSLPLFASGRSLAAGVRRSGIGKWLICDLFGIAEERLRAYGETGRERYLVALVLAVAAGSLTFVFAPHHMLALLGAVALALLILHTPEAGMVLSVGLCPLMGVFDRPTLLLLAPVGMTLFSFALKVLCGKRMLRMERTDKAVLALLALFLLGGVFSYGGAASLQSALTYVLLGSLYFVVANLVRTQDGVRRLLWALLAPCVLLSLIGIAQYVLSTPALDYLDLTLFADLGGRVSALWDNPNMLAEHLALLIPLFFAVLLLQRRLLHGFGSVICLVAPALCLVFTWTRGAWVGVLVAVLVLLLCMHRHTLSYLILAILPGAALLPLLPDTVVRRFASIGMNPDSSIRYRLNLWQGVRDMLFDHMWTGVGVGEQAFCTVYRGYAVPGVESAMHSHSLYLQLLCSVGIVGLAVFALAMLFWVRQALTYARYATARPPRLIVLGGLAGIVALLVMGLFDEIWYNYRIYMLFWTLCGLVTAQCRVGRDEAERAFTPMDNERTRVDVMLHIQ